MTGLVIRNVEVEGRTGVDVSIVDGRIAEIGSGLPARGEALDGAGGALIPGLVDHHIHLFALAAQAESLALDGVASASDFRARVEAALAARAPGRWLRVTGYHEAMAGELGRDLLDSLAPRHPIRVQHQTGSLWVLNTLALEAVGAETATRPPWSATPRVAPRDASGGATPGCASAWAMRPRRWRRWAGAWPRSGLPRSPTPASPPTQTPRRGSPRRTAPATCRSA